MARFRGVVEGSRGEASRCGTPRSGLTTVAQSWTGDIRVSLFDNNGEDWARIYSTEHGGSTAKRVLYDGPVSGALTPRKYPTP